MVSLIGISVGNRLVSCNAAFISHLASFGVIAGFGTVVAPFGGVSCGGCGGIGFGGIGFAGIGVVVGDVVVDPFLYLAKKSAAVLYRDGGDHCVVV